MSYELATNDLQDVAAMEKQYKYLNYVPMTNGVPDKIKPGYVRKSRRAEIIEPYESKKNNPSWVGVTAMTFMGMLVGLVLGVGL